MVFDILSTISPSLLLDAEFGLEREGLRVDQDGNLSTKAHPKVFGNKKENPYITTDFSESQLEFITPIFNHAEEAVDFLDSLYNIAVLELEDEYIWPQSMPSNTPPEHHIPVATFQNQESDQVYREYLSAKYGGKKQLISGIHINFSIGANLLALLYEKMQAGRSFQDFKNDLYLKMTRNCIRYNWLLVYLLGATNIIHKSYEENCVSSLTEISKETYTNHRAVSFRNSGCGYQNKSFILLDYSSLEKYVASIETYIQSGELKDIRELYAKVRLKSDGTYSPQSLLKNGIRYLELRTIDCNPFSKAGIAVEDMHFIHVFFLFCLAKEESTYERWLYESDYNGQMVAISGQSLNTPLMKEGTWVPMKEWGQELLQELLAFNQSCGLPFEQIIKDKLEIFQNRQRTYSYRIAKLCEQSGYINAHMELAKKYKEEAFSERFRLKPYTDMELSTQILLKESIKRGIRFHILDRKENFIQLSKGDHKELVKQATKTSKDQYVSVLAMENKTVTKKILRQHQINVPDGEEFDSLKKAKDALYRWVKKPLVVKPKTTNFGKGISIFPEGANELDLLKALEIAFNNDSSVLIEEFKKGKEYRFLVIGEETVAILHRVPANVVGDGTSTIAELIARKNEDPLRGKGYKTPLEKIEIDDNMKLFLKQQQKTINTVLSKGEKQWLRENSNISTGGDSIDVTDRVPQIFKDIAVQATKAVGATICGVDMIIEHLEDASSPYTIIELNFNPAIHIHSYPYQGKERNIAKQILELLQF